jgi:hypothetical protein
MNRRRFTAALVLMAWVFLGPIAMAFGSCGILGVTCDGLCGAASSVSQAPLPEGLTRHVAFLVAAPEEQPSTRAPGTLEPPPKSAPSLA